MSRGGKKLGMDRWDSWDARGKGLYPPESAARDELRLGAQGLGNELIVVGILGTVPAPAARKDQRTLRGWDQWPKGPLRPPGIVFAHQMLLELLNDIVSLAKPNRRAESAHTHRGFGFGFGYTKKKYKIRTMG